MNTKIKRAIVFLFATGSIFLFSCKKENQTLLKPQIVINEVGLNNSKIGYIGSDLHLDAEIIAEGKISTVKIVIHPEGSATWKYEETYNEFSNLKNANFHKHIDIPATAIAGQYHLHLSVVDMEGNKASVETEFTISEPEDLLPPIIEIANAPSNNQYFTNGDTINITGNVSDNIALGGIYIGLVRVNQNLTDDQVNASNTITILHTHNFSNPSSYSFSANIIVGNAMDNNSPPKTVTWEAGDYYVLVKCKDAFGSNWTFSNHYLLSLY
jgi:hypothetical protein